MNRDTIRKLVLFLVFVLILGLVVWGLREIIPMFGFPHPVVTVIWIILAIVAILGILEFFGLLRSSPPNSP